MTGTAPTAPTASTAAARTDRAARRSPVPGAAALGAAALSAAIGVTQVLYPQDLDPQIDPRTRVLLAGMTLFLWLLVPVYLRLADAARSALGARMASVGTVLLSFGSASSGINGEDLAIFPAVATLANALWFIGSVTLAVSLWRAGRVHRGLVVGLVFVMPLFIFGSQLGGGVPAGLYLAVLGGLLLRDRITR